MIEVRELTKRYGQHLAVDALSFTVHPGVVTGFLGPNGAGKSTTMRLILGLDRPDAGQVTVNGRPYRELRAPLTEMGALLDARAVHPARSARNHLRCLAATTGIPERRVDEVIELVGLGTVSHRRVGGFSLGMSQRLGIAAALLGDPATVMLDEPVNGMDPEGILWIRSLLGALADEGRTVFVSSHLMSEMELLADHFVVIGRGRLIADVPAEQLLSLASVSRVRVRCSQPTQLRYLLAGDGVEVLTGEKDVLEVTGLSAEEIGARAWQADFQLEELTPLRGSLEDVFIELTQESVEHRQTGTESSRGGVAA